MWTLNIDYYTCLSVFQQDDYYLLPAEPTLEYRAALFHVCEIPSVRQSHGVVPAGRVICLSPTKIVPCYRCGRPPGDDILTLYTLLRGWG
jgi:hypothetical protein